MTDTTPARRALLDLLLARVDRGVILPAERPLLRALITAEQAAADLPKQRHWRGTDGIDMANAYMTGQATLARVRALADSLESFTGGSHPDSEISRGLAAQWIRTALDGPSPTPDDAPAAPDDAEAVAAQRRFLKAAAGLTAMTSDEMAFETIHSNPGDWATTPEEQCTAHYIGPPPAVQLAPPPTEWGSATYRCERRRHDPGTGHATRLEGGMLYAWADDIAMYPIDDAPSEPQP